MTTKNRPWCIVSQSMKYGRGKFHYTRVSAPTKADAIIKWENRKSSMDRRFIEIKGG